ncbi:MAG: CHAT domain-containing protein [Cyanothece sp. SIO1E1]|nr:CHAT domain-containing protein [Cyanothece sp. SIO1E1]
MILALWSYKEGEYQKALDYYKLLLPISQDFNDQSLKFLVLGNIGLAYKHLGDYPEAIEYMQQAIAFAKERQELQMEAVSILDLGGIYSAMGDPLEALSYQQQALALAQEIQDRFTEGKALNNIGSTYRDLSEYDKAIEFYQQSLLIKKELLDYDGEFVTIVNLGNVSYDLGKYGDAISYYEESLNIAKSIGNYALQLKVLPDLAEVFFSQGDSAKAVETLERNIEMLSHIEDPATKGQRLLEIGQVYISFYKYDKAIELLQESLILSRQTSNLYQGEILSELSSLYLGSGYFTEAIEVSQELLDIAQSTGNLRLEGKALNILGLVAFQTGVYSEALEYQQRFLAISQASQSRYFEGQALGNTAAIYRNTENYTKALKYHQQSLEIFQELGASKDTAAQLGALGLTYLKIGDYVKAREYHQQSLEVALEVNDLFKKARALANLGVVSFFLGEYGEAIRYKSQSLAIYREIGDRYGEGRSLAIIGLSLLRIGKTREAVSTLYSAIEAMENQRIGLNDTKHVSIFEFHFLVYQALQQALVIENRFSEALEIAERGRARAFVELVSQQNSFEVIENLETTIQPPTLASIQQIAQAQKSTLVEYSLIDAEIGAPTLYIWVIQPNGDFTFHKKDLTNKNLAQLVSSNRNSLGGRGRGFELALDPQKTELEQLKHLHKLLIEPIVDLLPTDPNQRIILIPQGELFLVPFPALIDSEGTYLINKHTITTTPSIQVLNETQKRQQALDSQTLDAVDSWLLVGNPTMPSVWNPKTKQEERLPSLRYAKVEAEAIGNLFSVQPLLGPEATEIRIKQSISDADIIHLATHGLLEYGNPQDSGVNDIPGAIALAPGEGEDGLLTSAEIQELQLQANLVVLSACDTGLGNITGDGVIGLSRSLIAAGTPSVIVSLWSVPDDSTSILMQEFYRQWQSGLDKAQALRQAMLITKEQYPDPSSWAAFTLIGEAE